ncbi:MAG: hypothetical protein U0521_13005 [Anaerolineae bacterium]
MFEARLPQPDPQRRADAAGQQRAGRHRRGRSLGGTEPPEHGAEPLRDSGQVSGAVGVLGPMRINYGRAISAVSYVSGVMTDMLTTVYEALPPGDTPNEG